MTSIELFRINRVIQTQGKDEKIQIILNEVPGMTSKTARNLIYRTVLDNGVNPSLAGRVAKAIFLMKKVEMIGTLKLKKN